jgi:hypothetical protein
MKYIEQLHVEGLKKFEKLDIVFNPHLNIIVVEIMYFLLEIIISIQCQETIIQGNHLTK